MVFFIVRSRGAGALAPLLGLAGPVAGLLTWSLVRAPHDWIGVFAGLGLSIVGGGGLWLAARREYERSGDVSYDAQNDRPVVTNQTAGHLYFIPVWIWVAVMVVGGVAWAIASMIPR